MKTTVKKIMVYCPEPQGEAMKMRLLGKRWYTNFRHKGKKIQVALDAWGGSSGKPPNRAYICLGEIMSDLNKGLSPSGVRKKLSAIQIRRPSKRAVQVLKTHIYPFFGGIRWVDVDEALIEKYYETRWGLSDSGELLGNGTTVEKEMRVLTQLMRVVDKYWEMPSIKFKKVNRGILPPLTENQVTLVLDFLPKKYHAVYWVMAYTAMDVSDAVSLCPQELQDGWVVKPRGKSGQEIAVPICESLRAVLSGVPHSLDKTVTLFPEIKPKAVSTAIRRAFVGAGLEGYGAKYLRRYVASRLLDAGYSMDWVGKALAHADNSKVTRRYTKVYRSTLVQAFAKLG